MAKTSFATGNALTVKHWAAATFAYGVFKNYFARYIGKALAQNEQLRGVGIETSPNAMITKKQEFDEYKKGDNVTFGLIDPLTGAGVADDTRLEDAEEALSSHDFAITLHLRRQATRSLGGLNDIRPAFDVKAKSRMVLGMWLAREHDKDVIAAMSGVENAIATIAANAPSSTRHWYGGQTAAGVITTETTDALLGDGGGSDYNNYLFGEKVIEWVKRFVTLSEPIVRPILIGGEEFYVMFIHPYHAKALQASTDYKNALQNAHIKSQQNPLFSGMFAGSFGLWSGVIVHEIPKLETRLGAGGATAAEYFESGDNVTSGITVARALFCGAQALCVAYKGTPGWYEDKFDYGKEWGISLHLYMAIAKTEFNSVDYGVCAVDTCVVPD